MKFFFFKNMALRLTVVILMEQTLHLPVGL